MTKALRLIALDENDLAILSANLQDTLVSVADMAYLPSDKRFAFVGKRFDWVKACGDCKERCATGLHFDHVRAVSLIGFDQADGERTLNLLAIHFEPTDAPAGHIGLTFSGGAAVRLTVECLEAQMRDLGDRWTCDCRPEHPEAEAGSEVAVSVPA